MTATVQEQNRQLKSHLTEVFPEACFKVSTTARSSRFTVTWTDGPLEKAVTEAFRTWRHQEAGRWRGLTMRHRHSNELLAITMLRARRDHCSYYSELDTAGRPIEPGDVREAGQARASWTWYSDTVDASTVTDEERQFASVVLATVGPLTELKAGEDESEHYRDIGRVLFHYGSAIEAALSPV